MRCLLAALLFALPTFVACSSDGSSSGATPDAGTPSAETSVDAPPSETTACPGQKLLAVPDDPAAPGPWPVGARTVTIAGYTVEVWYPATVGSEAGKDKRRYDLREQLPPSERAKIPDAENPWQSCDCFSDLPLDDAHGPYPVVAFIHGTAGFRTQSATMNAHWASRGFVVVSADHPGIDLSDVLQSKFAPDQAADVGKILDALATPSGDAAFLAGKIDLARLAVAGHSAGGSAAGGFGDRAQVIIALAAGGSKAGTTLKSTLVMGGSEDKIVSRSRQQGGYDSSPATKRIVILAHAGHLAFSDLCVIGKDGGGLLAIAKRNGVTVPDLVASLATDGCQPGQLDPALGWSVIHHATSAALEETLRCSPGSSAAMTATPSKFGEVVLQFTEAK